jgi:LmbE family N-acetylglucosaminyl deacetylase
MSAIAHESVGALGTVLSVWAHPDDESFLAGGTMAACAAAGQRVVCVSATAGEHGTPDPAAWPPERLGRVRRWEAAAAMRVLGVEDHRFLGFEDGTLADVDPRPGIDTVAALIDEVRPDTILTFGPDGMTFHSDHITISDWTTAAWKAAGRPGRLLYATWSRDHLAGHDHLYETWGVYMTDERPAGHDTHEMAISQVLHGPALDQKLTALAAMASQTAASIAQLGPDLWALLNREECFVDASVPFARRAPVTAASGGETDVTAGVSSSN